MSDYNLCRQCGKEIEETGIQFRGLFFCSDECCEAHEENLLEKDEPELSDLSEEDEESLDDLEGDLEGDLGYDSVEDDDDLLDDDYNIQLDDF